MRKKNCILQFQPALKRVLPFLFLSFFFSLHIFGQEKTVTGTVRNEKGESLSGISVIVKDSRLGTSTGADGRFSVAVPNGKNVLIFSGTGYGTKEFSVNGLAVLDVQLDSKAAELGDVVVVGYGVQKKETVSGSIATVKGSEILKSPAIDVSNSLAGRVPGLTVIGQGGEPGNDASTILIRGLNTFQNSSPLFVVDGVPLQGADKLNHIDPSVIESITVLKDASAAIYGSQGANGVILITTKRGKAGGLAVSASFNQGFSQPTVLPKVLNSYQIAVLQNEAINQGIPEGSLHPGKYSVYELAGYANNSDPWRFPNTDWIHELIKPWASQNYANVNVSGGSDKLRGMLSLSSRYQDGFVRDGSGKFHQYDLRSNVDYSPSKYILLSVDFNGRLDNSNFPTSDAGTIFSQTVTAPPSRVAYWPNGKLGQPTDPTGQSGSPVAIGTPLAGYNRGDNYVLNSTGKLNIKVPWVTGLSFTVTGTIDRGFNFKKYWSIPVTYNQWDGISATDPSFNQVIQGDVTRTLTQSNINTKNYLFNFLADYEKKIGLHQIKLLYGYEEFERAGNSYAVTRHGFDADNLDQLRFGSNTNEVIDQNDPGASRWRNYLGRVNYSFNDKLFAEFLFRYQGSSIFYKTNRWGFFPGASLAYRISEEKFWKNSITAINNFKIRASWGRTGNDQVPPFEYLSLYQIGGYYPNYVEQVGASGSPVESSTLVEATSPTLTSTWEKADQIDVGFDADLFNYHLSVTFDYFHNKRSDILTPLVGGLPASTGIIPPYQNLGKFLNRGFDFNTVYKNSFGKVRFQIGLNGLYAQNKYLYSDETAGIPDYQKQTGHPYGSGLYYNAIGIYRTAKDLEKYPAALNGATPVLGDLIFEDANKDGKIDNLDLIRSYKSSVPVFSGGLNLNVGYGNFDLSVLFQGALGSVRYLRPNFSLSSNYLLSFYTKRWTPDNPNAEFPRVFSGQSAYWSDPNGVFNTFFLRKTDYVRLKNVEIGYTLPAKLVKKANIQSVRIYCSGLNLLTVAPDLKDFYTDPEEIVRDQFYGESYPLQRIINFGINVTF